MTETPVAQYCRNIKKRFNAGISTEHSYRADLQNLLQELVKGITITNEPKRQQCGAPDFIIQKKEVPVGYIEAKDIGVDLDKIEKSEQLKRYKGSLNNLILTDYSEFRFIRDGSTEKKIKLAEAHDGYFKALPENFQSFITHITDFCSYRGYTIKSSENLARMMAKKARMMEEVIYLALKSDDEDNSLKQQFEAFKKILIDDLTERYFADIYAQTIAYGMFAARLHDPSLEDFSREEALWLVPKSNPFLRQLFTYIAGPELDSRIVWIVNDLVDIFRGTDVKALLADFGKATQQTDPFIHFYETFLAEYDARLRKKRGVYYTPEPVVNFIVRAVDDILKTEFDLPQGLADTSKVEMKVDEQGYHKKVKKPFHKVQILDPATGTGTFLAEVVKQIYKKFENQKGIWSNYVENELIPRLNGFEILMASYTICHLKLEMLLRETGYKPKDEDKQQRLRVFLTNSLEEPNEFAGSLFATWLSREANEANIVKRDTPVMVVLGNPPYSGHSANKGEWIETVLKDYKQEPEGGKLKEQNAKWLNDDYVKFIRYGQYYIDKNKEGILAFITNNGYLDNPTFRGMRYCLLSSFNKIYIIDLHGSNKKKEKALDGSADVNVFDIQQGVSIIIAIKNSKRNCLVNTYDVFGERQHKYDFLNNNSLNSIKFEQFKPYKNNYLFKHTNEKLVKRYENGFIVLNLFPINVMGFQTHRDHFAIGWSKIEINKRMLDLKNHEIDDETIKQKYRINNNRDWKLKNARLKIKNDDSWADNITYCTYRPFDNRACYFSDIAMDYPRKELINHVHYKDNLLFGVGRQGVAIGDTTWCLALLSKNPVDANVFRRGGIYLCPLYAYPVENGQSLFSNNRNREPNLNTEIVNQISDILNLQFTPEKEDTADTFAPIDILDYIYAVLHSPLYRETFKEFLKIDFPRIPYPKDQETFWRLVDLGSELRQIHLLESSIVENFITSYPKEGDNIIIRKIVKKDFEIIDDEKQIGRVWINDEQYFEGVPVIAWEFYIGGYQPAQKWLKDRKGRELTFEDIQHYQKIIVALTETDRIMEEIDGVEFI